MTISPLPPAHLLTIAEYAALGEDERGRTELMEGNATGSYLAESRSRFHLDLDRLG